MAWAKRRNRNGNSKKQSNAPLFQTIQQLYTIVRTRMYYCVQSKKRIDKKKIVTGLRQALADVNLWVNQGELVGVAGIVGSGKSSLFAALLNDMENLSDTQSRKAPQS